MIYYKQIKSSLNTKASFTANVLTLMTGTTVAQGFTIGISPILSRLYTPDEFGIWTLFLSIVSLIAVISTGRYEMAIMLPEKEEDAVNIVALSFIIAFFVSIMTLLVVWIFNKPITQLIGNAAISPWLYIVPLSVFLTGIYQSLNYWSNRKKHFNRLAFSRIYQSTSMGISNLTMGLGGMGVSGLIGGSLIGQGFATGVMGWQVWRDDNDNLKYMSKVKIKENALKYRDFPKVNSLQAFVDMLQTSGVVFLISAFFGNVIVGLYSFTMRVLSTPLGLIGSSVSQVFFQRASETYNSKGDLHALVKKMMIKLSLIALPIMIVFMLFAPNIFSLIFGASWREAGIYSRILSPWFFFRFVISPISQVPIIVNKQKEVFYISLIGNGIIFLSIIYGGYIANNIKTGFYILSIFQSIYLISVVLWILKISKTKGKMV